MTSDTYSLTLGVFVGQTKIVGFFAQLQFLLHALKQLFAKSSFLQTKRMNIFTTAQFIVNDIIELWSMPTQSALYTPWEALRGQGTRHTIGEAYLSNNLSPYLVIKLAFSVKSY